MREWLQFTVESVTAEESDGGKLHRDDDRNRSLKDA